MNFFLCKQTGVLKLVEHSLKNYVGTVNCLLDVDKKNLYQNIFEVGILKLKLLTVWKNFQTFHRHSSNRNRRKIVLELFTVCWI